MAGGGGGDSATTTPAQRDGGQAQSGAQAGGGQKGSSYKLGDPVQGDKLLVTARPAGQCGAPTCKLNATYENKTNETQDEFIDRADFVLVDQQGRRFEAPASLDNVTVQPGGSKRVTFEFTDLPRDFKLARIQGDTGGATFELTP